MGEKSKELNEKQILQVCRTNGWIPFFLKTHILSLVVVMVDAERFCLRSGYCKGPGLPSYSYFSNHSVSPHQCRPTLYTEHINMKVPANPFFFFLNEVARRHKVNYGSDLAHGGTSVDRSGEANQQLSHPGAPMSIPIDHVSGWIWLAQVLQQLVIMQLFQSLCWHGLSSEPLSPTSHFSPVEILFVQPEMKLQWGSVRLPWVKV